MSLFRPQVIIDGSINEPDLGRHLESGVPHPVLFHGRRNAKGKDLAIDSVIRLHNCERVDQEQADMYGRKTGPMYRDRVSYWTKLDDVAVAEPHHCCSPRDFLQRGLTSM